MRFRLFSAAALTVPLACLATHADAWTRAVRANDFLNSIAVNSHIGIGRDYPPSVANAVNYAGFRAIRDQGNNIAGLISVSRATGAKFSLLPTSWNIADDIGRLEQLRAAGALLAAEGPNEPNNWAVNYGGRVSNYNGTFLPVAWFQRDLYRAVKSDPKLSGIPVFHASEGGGAEPDNVGLQFLTIPSGAGTVLPAGTQYADYANTHNYLTGFDAPRNARTDNLTWIAEAPGAPEGSIDGMYYEYGRTWHRGFNGYSNGALPSVPRVTTETGWNTSGSNAVSEDRQGKLSLNLYLAAYKRGWSYTFIYELRDFPGDWGWGLFRSNYSPKPSATYIHNLTTILADRGSISPGSLDYSIPGEPWTVHDLLIQKSNGTFELAVWDERVSGSDRVTVNLGRTYSTVNVYDPTRGTSPIWTLNNVASLPLTLSDHPVIVELR